MRSKVDVRKSNDPPRGRRSSFELKRPSLRRSVGSSAAGCCFCSAFPPANDGNVSCDWKAFAFLFLFQTCLLKSPLTALIVTGFRCFSSETRLYKKHTETGKHKLCECSVDGCVFNLYSHCKIKTACLHDCYVNVFFISESGSSPEDT